MRPSILALSYLFPNEARPGYGIFVLNRLRAVAEHCAVKVVAPIQWYPFIRLLGSRLSGGHVPAREMIGGLDTLHPRFAVVPRYFKWFDAISYLLAAHGAARRLHKEGSRFDLVDAHWTYPDIVAAHHLARRWGKPYIVTVRGHEALYQEEHSLRRHILVRYLRRADAVVTLSEELRERVIGLGIEPAKVHVILNGVDIDRFQPLDQAFCRRELGLPLNGRMILSVGRLTPGKGHQDIIRAVAQLQRDSDVALHIIGGVNPEENFEPELRALVRELGVTNVHFHQDVDQHTLRLWYCASDLFCLATRREGCPNVVLEALACGTPVVATDAGAISETVVAGENGHLVNLDQLALLPSVLQQALGQHWDREHIAAGMRRWSWAHCAEQVRNLYRSLLKCES